MNEGYVPMVQVECNTMPSRDEHGIPRFLTRCAPQPMMIPPGMHPTVPAMPPPPARLPMFAPHHQQAMLRAPTIPQMMPAVHAGYPGAYTGIDYGAIPMIYREQSPPSPSVSSTVSSVYEDCVSLPSSSPQSHQHDPFLQGQAPGRESDHRFMTSSQQSVATVPPLSQRSRSLTSVHSDSSANIGGGKAQTPSIKPEDAMTIVNEKLRNRIADLEKKMQCAMTEVTFLGDRNWRLEAHLDSLMHTLEILGVTDVEDLTGKTLPLPMFRVKVKAGYRLGPFNRLPRRALWSYEDSSKEAPHIDFGSERARTIAPGESKYMDDEEDDDGFQVPAGTDIGLSVRQMFHYERQIEELQQQCHALSGQTVPPGPGTGQEHLMMAGFETGVDKLREENAELLEDLEDTKAELCRVVQRIRAYERCDGGADHHANPTMPASDEASGNESSSSYGSHTEYGGHPHGAEHHGRDLRRGAPFYHRHGYGPARGEHGGHRRRYRDQHPRGRRVANYT